MAISLKMCVLYESLYMEPDVFIRENQRFQRAALEEYRAHCVGDHQSEECEETLIGEIAVCHGSRTRHTHPVPQGPSVLMSLLIGL